MRESKGHQEQGLLSPKSCHLPEEAAWSASSDPREFLILSSVLRAISPGVLRGAGQ